MKIINLFRETTYKVCLDGQATTSGTCEYKEIDIEVGKYTGEILADKLAYSTARIAQYTLSLGVASSTTDILNSLIGESLVDLATTNPEILSQNEALIIGLLVPLVNRKLPANSVKLTELSAKNSVAFQEGISTFKSFLNRYKNKFDEFRAGILKWTKGLQGVENVFKNIDLITFKKTFTATEEQYVKAYQLWGEEKWNDLYKYFKENDLNNWNGINWPPFNGAKSIIKTEKGNQLAGKVFDRFQGSEQLSGGFASPVLNSNEGVGDLVFTYDSRALADRIQDGTHYIKFKLKDNVPANLEFEYGEAIPWFKLQGNADQAKTSIKFQDLMQDGYIEILEVLKKEDNVWKKIK